LSFAGNITAIFLFHLK